MQWSVPTGILNVGFASLIGEKVLAGPSLCQAKDQRRNSIQTLGLLGWFCLHRREQSTLSTTLVNPDDLVHAFQSQVICKLSTSWCSFFCVIYFVYYHNHYCVHMDYMYVFIDIAIYQCKISVHHT